MAEKWQANGRKWREDGGKMAGKWRENGEKMAGKWRENGKSRFEKYLIDCVSRKRQLIGEVRRRGIKELF